MIVDIYRMAFSKSQFTHATAQARAKVFNLDVEYETDDEFIFEDPSETFTFQKQFRELEGGLQIELAIKMKIEEMTPTHLASASDDEVRQAWHRLNQWYALAKQENRAIEDYVNAGVFVLAEFDKRGFDHDKTSDLAKAVEEFKKQTRKFDMRSLIEQLPQDDLVVVKDFIAVVGSSVIKDNPHDLDVLFRANHENNSALIQSENLWLPIRKVLDPNKDGYLQFIWNPAGGHSSNIPLYDLVLRRRSKFEVVEVKGNEVKAENDSESTRGEAADSQWTEHWQNEIPKDGKGGFVYHHHWRGLSEDETKLDEPALLKTDHSVHGDLRLEGNANLWGFTVFQGTTEDVRQAGGDRLRHLGEGDKLQGSWKLPQPKEWLHVGMPSPMVVKPNGVGATANAWAKFFAVDKGHYEMGVAREHMFEIFLHGNDLKGRFIIEYAPVAGGQRVWLIDKPTDQTPYADSHKLDEVVKELKSKGQKWLYWAKPGEKPQLIDVEHSTL